MRSDFSLNTGFYGDKFLYKNFDLTQDFPNKILFHLYGNKLMYITLPRFSDDRKCGLLAKS